MLNEKLLEILSHEVDSAVTIVTQGEEGPYLVNTWNSYINITEKDELLIPAYGFMRTGNNLLNNDKIKISIANKEVEGYRGPGTGVIIEGTGVMLKEGPYFDLMKEKFDWLRAVLVITVKSCKQTF